MPPPPSLSLPQALCVSCLTKFPRDGLLGCFLAFAATSNITTSFICICIYVHARGCLQDKFVQVELQILKVCDLLNIYWKIFPT